MAKKALAEMPQQQATVCPALNSVPLLLQLLLELGPEVHHTSLDGEELILDVQIEGVRYRLLRQHLRTSRLGVSLSPREIEIARMVAQGYPNKVIAAVLDISSWTVCTYLRRLFAKLGVTSRAAMVAQMMDKGLMPE